MKIIYLLSTVYAITVVTPTHCTTFSFQQGMQKLHRPYIHCVLLTMTALFMLCYAMLCYCMLCLPSCLFGQFAWRYSFVLITTYWLLMVLQDSFNRYHNHKQNKTLQIRKTSLIILHYLHYVTSQVEFLLSFHQLESKVIKIVTRV